MAENLYNSWVHVSHARIILREYIYNRIFRSLMIMAFLRRSILDSPDTVKSRI